jgi:hypothetical protein
MPSHRDVLKIRGEHLKIEEVVLAAVSELGATEIKLSRSAMKMT